LFKNLLLFIMLISVSISANNFKDGMIAFKKGDFQQAKKSFMAAATKDKVLPASYMLGRMYLHGKGVSVNLNKAIKLLGFAYSYGNIPAGCYRSEAYIKSDKKVYMAAEGVKRGMAIHLPYCTKVFNMWRAYNSDISTFSSNLRNKFLKK